MVDFAEIRITAPAGFAVEELGRGRVAVRTPRGDEQTVSWLRNRNAKWDRERRAWIVPGTKRAELAERFDAMIAEASAAAAAAKAGKEEAKAALRERASALASIKGIRVHVSGAAVIVAFPSYNAEAVAAVKALPGARWDARLRQWSLAPASAADVAAIESGLTKAGQSVVADARRKEEARKAAAEARASERAARILRRVGDVKVGQTLRLGDRVVTVTGIGKDWFLRSEDACMYGMLPEDCRVAYAYHRPATAEEIAALEAAEEAARAQAEAKAALAEVEKTMREEGRCLPSNEIDHEAIEAGEVLLETGRHLRAYGGGRRWVLAGDTLWMLDGNGGDGDDWSRSNHGREIALCMAASDSMVEVLRRCGRMS